MDRQELLEFFRQDDLLDNLKECDRYEIALHCVSHSDFLYKELENLIEKYENGEES